MQAGPTVVPNTVPNTTVPNVPEPTANTVPTVVKPAVVTAAAPAAAKVVVTQVKSGALPFTGTDIGFLAALAALFVLAGAGFLIMQVRLDCHQNLLVGEDLPRRGILGPY